MSAFRPIADLHASGIIEWDHGEGDQMRTLMGAAMALGLVSCLQPAQLRQPAGLPLAEARSDLLTFADAFDQAQLAKNRQALERMVADDLVFIDASGKRLGKKEFIEGWTTPGDSFEPIVLVDRQVVLLGSDAGIVSAETVLKGSSGGKQFSSRLRFSDTFERVNGNWQAVHIQVTRIAASASSERPLPDQP